MAQAGTVIGFHAVQALLERDPTRLQQLVLLDGRRDQRLQALEQQARELGLPISYKSRAELDRLSHEANHQGVVAQCLAAKAWSESAFWQYFDSLKETPFLLILDGVTDPHNLGACLRSAEAAGVQAVIAPKDKSAGLNATVSKVACGAAEILPFVAVTNLSRTLEKLKVAGVWLVGAAGEAEQTLHQQDLSGPLGLVMGAEGKGLRRLTREHCDFLVSIPMAGSVSSLNVSVATGVCLFEALRQRRG